MSNPDHFLDELGPDRVWRIAYQYYLRHRLHGLGSHGRLLGIVLYFLGGVLQIASLYQPRIGLSPAQPIFYTVTSAVCFLAGTVTFLLWLRIIREAKQFACNASDSRNCTEQDIAALYQANYLKP